MHMGNENSGYFFPSEVEPANRHLRSLACVKKKELAFAANEHACELSVWQGHHAARAEYKCFQIH